MKKLGDKIREARKIKSLSQEELADLAKVNLRTIQRIENNQNEPRGKTLSLICEVLEINTEDILDYGKQTDQNYLVFLHLSVLSFLILPIGNILLPLILWLTKKDKVIGLKAIGANILNFQIVWTVLTFFSITGYAFSMIMHYRINDVLFYTFVGLYLANIILPVFFAFKAKKGQVEKNYPNPIKLIK